MMQECDRNAAEREKSPLTHLTHLAIQHYIMCHHVTIHHFLSHYAMHLLFDVCL